jgi:hypothetical protein
LSHHSQRASRAGVGLTLLILASLTVSLFAGCGGSSEDVASKSAPQILAASRAAAAGASSVHINSRNALGRLSLTMDSQFTGDGGQIKLTFLGLRYEVIRLGKTVYVKGNPAFYRRVLGQGVHVPTGAWLKAPASNSAFARFVGLTDLSSRISLLLRSTGPLVKGATTTVQGQPAVELKQTGKLFTGTTAVATSGKPYPLQILKHGRESGQTTFTGWNAPVSLHAPADTVELSQLQHNSG